MTDENTPPEPVSKEELRDAIKSAVNQLGPQVSKDEKKEHAKLLVKIFEQGMSPKQAMNISEEEILQIYSFAYHNFSTGKFAEARELFKVLLTLDPMNADFATALGVCHHRLGDYDLALACYMLNAFLAPKDPVALFYGYDCLINLKDEASAAMLLSSVIARAGDQKIYGKVKQDAQKLFERLEQKLINQQAGASESS